MKKIISWKKLIVPCALLVLFAAAIAAIKVLGFGSTMQAFLNQQYQTYFEPEMPSKGSLEELYQDVFMTLLSPHIQEAVNNYYEENMGYSPYIALWQPEILSIERPNGYRTFVFVIKLEVTPYLGAHYPVGVDHITIRISSGEVKVEKFEHLKSYPIPSRLQ